MFGRRRSAGSSFHNRGPAAAVKLLSMCESGVYRLCDRACVLCLLYVLFVLYACLSAFTAAIFQQIMLCTSLTLLWPVIE